MTVMKAIGRGLLENHWSLPIGIQMNPTTVVVAVVNPIGDNFTPMDNGMILALEHTTASLNCLNYRQ